MDPALSRLPDSMSLTSFGRRAVRAIRRGNKGVIELIMRCGGLRCEYREVAGVNNAQIGKPPHGGSSQFNFLARYLERAISTLAWRGTTTPFVYLCYTSLVGDGHHQKYECDTNFFVCLLVRRYRIDALPLRYRCRWSASHRIAVQEPGFCHA